MKQALTTTLAALCLATAFAGHAEVTVKEPWVRSTVAKQKATGFFVQLQSLTDAKLVAASSPVAAVTEVHEMTMEKDAMKMRPVSSVDLPAGKSVKLKPGGYHVMLMDLKRQVKAGDTVPITLVFEGKDGKRESQKVDAPVRALNATGVMPAEAVHSHKP